jgi:immunoglobulin-like protein involved in spore germination
MKRYITYLFLGVALTLGLASTSCGEERAQSTRPVNRVESGTAVPADGPLIVVEHPSPSESVSSPVEVSGTANVFEANVTVRILDHNGAQLARDFTTATCGTGCRGTFSIRLAYRSPTAQSGTIVVSDDDADGDGTPQHSVTIPVQLAQS